MSGGEVESEHQLNRLSNWPGALLPHCAPVCVLLSWHKQWPFPEAARAYKYSKTGCVAARSIDEKKRPGE